MAQGVEFPQLVDRIPGVFADTPGAGGVALMSIGDHDRSRAVAGSDDDGRRLEPAREMAVRESPGGRTPRRAHGDGPAEPHP